MANYGSWVVDVEKMIGDTAVVPSTERRPSSIYQVPEYIKNTTNPNAYRPQVVSLGPFHHGDAALLPMEVHKRRAVAHRIKRIGQPLRAFIDVVEKIAEQLYGAYENLDEKKGHRERFVELMVTDGCFFLEVRRMAQLKGKVDQDYGPHDHVFSKHSYLQLINDIISDMLIIENQLPLLLLQKLMFIPPDSDSRYQEAGIHFKLSEADGLIGAISFERGVLSIPQILLDGKAERLFLNLMAFERLHPYARNDVTAFLFFVHNLINTTKDVALMKSKGIIKSALGSDEVVADLINKTLTKGTVISEERSLHNVLRRVNAHCEKPWNKWRAYFVHTYFSNPWVFISLVAAVVLLVATLMQTVYAIVPFYKDKDK